MVSVALRLVPRVAQRPATSSTAAARHVPLSAIRWYVLSGGSHVVSMPLPQNPLFQLTASRSSLLNLLIQVACGQRHRSRRVADLARDVVRLVLRRERKVGEAVARARAVRAGADLGARLLDLVAVDAEIPRRLRLPLERAAGVLALDSPGPAAARSPDWAAGMSPTAVAVPPPVNGVSPLNRKLCGIQFVYARALNTSYMPPRMLMYMSSRPKFSP